MKTAKISLLSLLIMNLLIVNVYASSDTNSISIVSNQFLGTVLIGFGAVVILVAVFLLLGRLKSGDSKKEVIVEKKEEAPVVQVNVESQQLPPIDNLTINNPKPEMDAPQEASNSITSEPVEATMQPITDVNNLPKVPLSELTNDPAKEKSYSLDDIQGDINNKS